MMTYLIKFHDTDSFSSKLEDIEFTYYVCMPIPRVGEYVLNDAHQRRLVKNVTYQYEKKVTCISITVGEPV